MGRLKALRPALRGMAPTLGFADLEAEAARQVLAPWRAWYKTERWRRLSWAVRVEEAFTCRRCGAVEGRSGQTVADHILAHRGDEVLFWDRTNLQCLCKTCHDGAKQREEAAARRLGPRRTG